MQSGMIGYTIPLEQYLVPDAQKWFVEQFKASGKNVGHGQIVRPFQEIG